MTYLSKRVSDIYSEGSRGVEWFRTKNVSKIDKTSIHQISVKSKLNVKRLMITNMKKFVVQS